MYIKLILNEYQDTKLAEINKYMR